jgi:hypothetical protein
MNAARRKRFEQILWAYVVATGGRLPVRDDLLPAISAEAPGVTFEELADAVQWAIRRSKRVGALLERRLKNEPAAPRATRPGRMFE